MMKIEEAIYLLDQIGKLLRYDPSWLPSAKIAIDEAINMAIEALQEKENL